MALLAVLALFLGACGGGSKKSDSTGTSGAASSTGASSSTGAGSSSTGSSGAGATGGSGSGLPISSDLSSLASYHWEVTLEGKGAIVAGIGLPDLTGGSGAASDSIGYNIKGAWIKPDKAQMELTTGGVSLKQTVVGNQQWTTIAGSTQGPVPADPGAAQDLQLSNFFDVKDIFSDVQGFDCGKSQSVNGVQATVCEADKADYERMAQSVAGLLDNSGISKVNNFSLKVYIAKDGGYVVKTDMTMDGKGTDSKDFSLTIHLNVTDIGKVSDIKP